MAGPGARKQEVRRARGRCWESRRKGPASWPWVSHWETGQAQRGRSPLGMSLPPTLHPGRGSHPPWTLASLAAPAWDSVSILDTYTCQQASSRSY